MKKPIFVFAISLAFVFALTLPRRDASAQRDKSAEKLARAKEVAHNIIAERASRHGITDRRDLKVKRAEADEQEKTHTRFQQTHKGVPVFGGEAIVHLNPDDSVFAVTDDLVEFVGVDTEPRRPRPTSKSSATAATTI